METNYKELYESALKRANSFKSQEFRDITEYIFPELKEPEDKKMRRWIINYLDNKALNSGIIQEKTNIKNAIAWLEKQGKQKPADKVEPKFKVGDKIVEDNEFGMVGGEITDIDDTHYELDGGGRYIPISHQDNYKLVEEQKPAWSEEDITIINNLVWAIANDKINPNDREDYCNWLKSLKDRVQPQSKVEWSEEDIKHLYDAIREIQANFDKDDTESADYYKELINWLKSLRPQKQWKPSEGQMEALKEACDEHWEPDGLNPLYTLYQNIKKLKGE